MSEFANPRERWLAGLALVGFAMLIAVARLRTYSEPFETDIACYAVVARELLAGKHLYSEVWDIKPPGVFLAYAAALTLAADDVERAVYLLNCVAAWLTLVGVYAAAKSVAGRGIGLLAAGCWTLVCGDMRLQANQPNTEVFMNAAHVWAVALLLGGVRRYSSANQPIGPYPWNARVIGAGLLVGVAAIFKHVSLALVPPLTAALVFALLPGVSRRRAIGLSSVFVALVFWAWLVSAIWFAAAGRWFDFRATLFDFGIFYAGLGSGGIAENLLAGFHPGRLFPSAMSAVLPLAILSLVGLVVWIASRPPSHAPGYRFFAMLAAYGVGVCLAIMLPGQFYPHYYQLWLPLLCVAAAAAVAAMARSATTLHLANPRILGVVLVASLVGTQGPAYLLPAEEWSQRKYGPVFVEARNAARKIRRMLQPGETMFVWGQYGGFYIYSGARPASGFFFLTPLLWSPYAELHSRRALEDLRRTPPELIVEDRRDVPPYPNHPIVRFFHAAYVPLPKGTLDQDRYRIWYRRGGALAGRHGPEQEGAP
ncbi:MAG: glycosyltransferase family 39 protein [Candidatus Sumerlaeaceae bacterium]|nr:glycosyltransferase family 39 protein [Candidatus Sumerlaeaceae bacterium]